MANVVENQIESNTPILMCSVPGNDASSRVDDLAVGDEQACHLNCYRVS